MKAEMVYRYVGQRLARLQALSEQPRKAMLAKLRRGVGGIPGDIPVSYTHLDVYKRQGHDLCGHGPGRLYHI